MKVKVDYDLCESNALCCQLAPEVFELDDDDYLQVKQEYVEDEELRGRIRQAVAACPRAAISVVEEEHAPEADA